ncbi:MAG: aldehyde dehydrogenase family protein [Candidatus Omnitrophica bacterium]|nr:aldehyde dehydrogenase family protein [Candidatus Omnitrophota bacterium]
MPLTETPRLTLMVRNPYRGAPCGEVPMATSEDVQRALVIARQTKYQMTGKERAGLLRRVAEGLTRRKNECARVITDESGLCLKDTLYEVDRAVRTAHYAAIVAERIDEDTTGRYRLDAEDLPAAPRLKVITEPWDLVVAVTPFNHPLNQVAHKVFPAVAAGASMVLKPSPKTPLSAFLLGRILEEAGLEKNVLQIVVNDRCPEIVRQLVVSPLVDMVTFTGQREVGIQIARWMVSEGQSLKQYVPELGGCSSFIIHRDADLPRAAELAVKGCFGNSGQRCTCIRRIVVVEEVADEFVDRFVRAAERLTCGDPYDPKVDMGTVISEEAGALIQQRVRAAIRDGAVLRLGDKRQGALYPPTILDEVRVTSELVAKETFGPVGPVIRVKEIDEAVEVAKNSEYALAGGIMTGDRALAQRVAKDLAVGQFSWNGIPSYRTETAPFGGFRGSGNGLKEGVVLAAESMRRIRTVYEHS